MKLLKQSKLCQRRIIFIVQLKSNKFFLIIAQYYILIQLAYLENGDSSTQTCDHFKLLGCYHFWPQSETINELHTIRLYRCLHCVLYCTS